MEPTTDPTTTQRPSTEDLAALVEPVLRAAIPGWEQVTVEGWQPAERGYSTETFLLEVHGAPGRDGAWPLVLRRPPEVALFPDYDLLRQVRVMRALEGSGIPVPSVVHLDRDTEALGSPYVVMERISSIGTVTDIPSHHSLGLYAEVDPAGRRRMWDGLIDTMARVHRLDWRELGLGWLTSAEPGTNPLVPLIDYLETALPWAHPAYGDTLARGLAHLRSHMPEPTRTTLCWGDARLSNVLYTESLDVAAALDWEIAFIGPHECDLAWALFLERAATVQAGVEPLEGTPTRDEIIAAYETASGLPVGDLDYYEVLAAVLLAVPILRLATTFGVDDPVDFVSFCNARIDELVQP